MNVFLDGLMRRWSPTWTLCLLLLVGGANGLAHVVSVPPFWHYDEPGHFEYAWLLANRPGRPQTGAHDESMRRKMAEVLDAVGWYDIRNYRPDFASQTPIWIGLAQTDNQPGYYWLAALPLRLLRNADIATQYAASRLVSSLLFLATLWLAWMIAGEAFGPGHALQWMLVGLLALLPGFVDVMTSVSDDVGAVFAFTLFLWAAVRLLRRGYSFGNLALLAVSLIACFLSKNTAWPALLMVPGLVLLRWNLHRFFAALMVAGAILAALSLSTASPVYWLQVPARSWPLRIQTDKAPLGDHALAVEPVAEEPSGYSMVGQLLGPSTIRPLGGKMLTLGYWAWSDREGEIPAPFLRTLSSGGFADSARERIHVSSVPRFLSVQVPLPAQAVRSVLVLPYPDPANEPGAYFDGLVLAQGTFSSGPPVFAGDDLRRGTWDGHAFLNLIRNSSAEAPGLNVRPWLDSQTAHVTPINGRASLILASLLDPPGAGWYYVATFDRLQRTFWASSAGAKVPLWQGDVIYPVLWGLMVVAALGIITGLHRRRGRNLRRDVLACMALALALLWGLTAIRGAPELLVATPVIPWARYAFPAIIPAGLFLCAGWLSVGRWLSSRFGIPTRFLAGLYVFALGTFDLIALLSILQYFHPDLRGNRPIVYLGLVAAVLFAACLLGAGFLNAAARLPERNVQEK